MLAQESRDGCFNFDASDLSAEVASDPIGGVYIPPPSDPTGASGAWVRQFSGPVDIRWFGAVADCTGYGVGTDNSPIIQAVGTLLSGTGGSIYVPEGQYRCASQIVFKSAVRIVGTTVLQDSTSATIPQADKGSTLVFDAGVGGLLFRYITDTDTVGPATNPGCSGTIIEGIRLVSGSAGSSAAGKYGIESRAKITMRDCEVRGFGDHGIVLHGSVTAAEDVPYGDVNCSRLDVVSSLANAGAGFFMEGGDANVITLTNCRAASNAGYGFDDNGLIGNEYIGCLTEGNTAGTFINRRAAAAASYIGCETEGGPFSVNSSALVLGSTMGQVNGGQRLQVHGLLQAYDGLNLQSAGTLTLANAANTGSVTLANDGTNARFTGPVLTIGNLQCRAGALGYAAGSSTGGTVTQTTSKSTGVTLNTFCGQITMNNAALASGVKVSFVVSNSNVAATDTIVVCVASGGTANAYRAAVTAVAAGSFTITVENIAVGSLSEAPVITFSIVKAVTA